MITYKFFLDFEYIYIHVSSTFKPSRIAWHILLILGFTASWHTRSLSIAYPLSSWSIKQYLLAENKYGLKSKHKELVELLMNKLSVMFYRSTKFNIGLFEKTYYITSIFKYHTFLYLNNTIPSVFSFSWRIIFREGCCSWRSNKCLILSID